MKFGAVPVHESVNGILAHSIRLPKRKLPKGLVLTASDIAALADAGYSQVVVARPELGDLTEDDAAARLGAALAGDGVRTGPSARGRTNLFSQRPGVLNLDPEAIAAANLVNPMITIATLPPFARVAVDQMVATVKIISYAVPQSDVDAVIDICAGALRVLPCQYQTATLIETSFDAVMPIKGRAALQTRLDRFSIALSPRTVVAHHADVLSKELLAAEGQVIFILTASATADPADVGPAALRLAGGQVTQVGMPVDPGNLLFLGALGDKPVIGLPGCARSVALNGADWVMDRVLCGVRLRPDDFARMGVGGLLKETPNRPQPRRG